MAQFHNFDTRRYFSTLIRMNKSGALKRAADYRKKGLLSRVSPDGEGTYTVWTASRRKK